MRSVVNILAQWGTLVAILLSLPSSPVHAQAAQDDDAGGESVADVERETASRQEGADLWVPSFSIISGASVQEWESSAISMLTPGPTVGNPNPVPVAIRPPSFEDDRDVAPFVGGNLELMSPTLPIPFSPRLFVGGEVVAAFGFERRVARESDPSSLGDPTPAGSGLFYREETALGQGAETVAEIDDFIYGAYAGIAFPFELYGRQLRIKPSFAWIRFGIDIDGLVVDATCLTPPPFPPLGISATTCNAPNSFQRGISLAAQTSEDFDGIGPGLDIELDAFRVGSLGASVFASGRLYKILGDTTIDFRASPQTLTDPIGTNDVAEADFSFEIDDLMYRFGVGLRFHWLGSD